MYDIRKGQIVESLTGRFTKEQAEKELKKRQKRNAARKAVDDAYKSCGMKKVRGALGGTYYE